jgi:hypothetical protein
VKKMVQTLEHWQNKTAPKLETIFEM